MASSKEIHINGRRVDVLDDNVSPIEFLTALAKHKTSQHKHNAFYVANLSDIVRQYRQQWSTLLPRVYPHYAVKCNDDPVVLATLARLGIGFDCASKKEIEKVLQLQQQQQQQQQQKQHQQCDKQRTFSPEDRIIFANTCKKASHIRFAASVGVKLMTFDNESELYKVKELHPNAEMVVRLKVEEENRSADVPSMGQKFGCTVNLAIGLLGVAKKLGINVVGVAFHVGSLCFDRIDPKAYVDMIESSKKVFDAAETIGFKFDLLDIGGGFLGNKEPKVPFSQVTAAIRGAIDRCFPEQPGLRIIAEPGRFFVTSAFTLANNVIGVKRVVDGNTVLESDVVNGDVEYHYTLIDGAFSSMLAYSSVIVRSMSVVPKVLADADSDKLHRTVLWGPTCCGLDCITRSCLLPKQTVGDWIVLEDMGAYTRTLATTFNGMPRAKVVYIVDKKDVDEFSDQ